VASGWRDEFRQQCAGVLLSASRATVSLAERRAATAQFLRSRPDGAGANSNGSEVFDLLVDLFA
jgi:hypothetical protein